MYISSSTLCKYFSTTARLINKHKRKFDQYLAVRTSRLVNNPYMFLFINFVVWHERAIFGSQTHSTLDKTALDRRFTTKNKTSKVTEIILRIKHARDTRYSVAKFGQ